MDSRNHIPIPGYGYNTNYQNESVPQNNAPPTPYFPPWGNPSMGNTNTSYWPFPFAHAPPSNIPPSPYMYNPVPPMNNTEVTQINGKNNFKYENFNPNQIKDREPQRQAIENYILSLLGQPKGEPTYSQPKQDVNPQTAHSDPSEDDRMMQSITSNMESLLSEEPNINALLLSSSPSAIPEQLLQPKKFVKNKTKRKLLYTPLPTNYDALNKDILEVHASLKPNAADVAKRQKLLSNLQAIVSEIWPDATPVLHLFGSSANDFG
jgi:hypothetical protein